MKVRLFHRNHAQGLTLTPVGQIMLREAEAVLECGHAFLRLAEQVGAEEERRLNVGCFSTLAPLLMTELTESFAALHPRIKIETSELDQEQIFEALRRQNIDVAITFGYGLADDMEFRHLAELPLQVWMSEHDQLAAQSEVTLNDIAQNCVIVLDLPITRDLTLAAFQTEQIIPRRIRRSQTLENIRTLVANGFGYFIAAAHPRSDYALDGRKIIRRPLASHLGSQRLGLVMLARASRSELLSSFEQHCQASISEAYIPGVVAPSVNKLGPLVELGATLPHGPA